jgi:hypothetical protein
MDSQLSTQTTMRMALVSVLTSTQTHRSGMADVGTETSTVVELEQVKDILTLHIGQVQVRVKVTVTVQAHRASMITVHTMLDNSVLAVEEVFNTRIDVCNSCEHLAKEYRSCTKCACPVDHKAKYLANTCPEGKW